MAGTSYGKGLISLEQVNDNARNVLRFVLCEADGYRIESDCGREIDDLTTEDLSGDKFVGVWELDDEASEWVVTITKSGARYDCYWVKNEEGGNMAVERTGWGFVDGGKLVMRYDRV